MPRRRRLTAAIALLIAAICALAQRGGGGRFERAGDSDDDHLPPAREAEFHFLRLEYTDLPQFHRRWGSSSRDGIGSGWWMVDWPAADNHFTSGVGRLTRIDAGDPRHVRLTDPHLFDYPWIYATQTGWWGLDDREVLKLREYLLKGGFLVVDDFWGDDQWAVFKDTMDRVLPGQPISDIAETDTVMHVLFDIREKDRTFIPGSRHLRRGANGQQPQVVQPEGTQPAWRAIYSPGNKMVVAVNYETDFGDGWKFADVPYYPAEMTALAYRFGLNYVIYSMTH